MRKSKFLPLYKINSKGVLKTIFPDRKRSGVYVIKDPHNKICYIGMSQSDVYKALYRHFQIWNDKFQDRVTYPREGYKVRLVYCTVKQAIALEQALIAKHQPYDNLQVKAKKDLNRYAFDVLDTYTNTDVNLNPIFEEFKGEVPF
jgi:excinuclease UvrABC nuclease subunit